MIISSVLALGLLRADTANLGRVFKAGEKQEYAIAAHLLIEARDIGLLTWVPEELDINYKFNTEVKESKADGIVDMVYLRPTMTQIEGETADSPPKSKVEKTNLNMLLTVTPSNEVISMKDLTKKDTKKNGKGGGRWMGRFGSDVALQDVMGYVQEIYRIALSVGSLDSSLDFAPTRPFDDVEIGATWKKTIGYSPQTLKGAEGKSAVQRLDFTYTYKGLLEVKGKKVYRVTADLDLSTDLAAFMHQMTGTKPAETGIRQIPLNLKTHIDFDLDATTRHTVLAVSKSEGSFSVESTQATEALHEEKLHGLTTMKLVQPAKG